MKGGRVCVIPGGVCDRHASLGMTRMSKEQDQAREATKHGRSAITGRIGSLALGCDAHVSPTLLERRLQTPSVQKRAHDALAVSPWFVEHSALGGRFPCGSRVRTQQMGKGAKPARSHNAVPVQISRVRSPWPSHDRVRRCHMVGGSARIWSREGRRAPTTRGRPMGWLSRSGGSSCRTASR
jgi:hypothetical protein